MILLNHNIHDLQGFNVASKDLLNILAGLRLGQVIRGKVLSILSTGELLVLLNGQKIKAHSNLNLDEGDSLFLKVLSLKPSIVLRLYGIEYAKDTDPISKVLKMFNIERSPLIQKIVSAFLQNELSIDKAEIQKIADILNIILDELQYDNIKPKDPDFEKLLSLAKSNSILINEENLIDTVIFLKSKNIPLTPKAILIVLNHLNEKSDLSANVNELLNNIASLKSIFGNQKYSDPEQVPGYSVVPLEKLITELGYDFEKRIMDIKQGHPEKLRGDVTLKQLMLEVINSVTRLDGLENPEKLKLLAMKILNNIEFHQLMNSDDSAEIKNWYFQTPIRFPDETRTIELKISGQNKKSSMLNKVPYNFNIAVEFSELGKVRAYGSLYQTNLSLSFYLKEESLINAFKDDIGYLEERLKKLSINLNNSTFELEGNEKNSEAGKFFNEAVTSINIKV